MTDQEINVAIAEALGVKADPNPDRDGKPCPGCDSTGRRRYGRECSRCHGTGKLSVRVKRRPDYCNDLNAMHEAEKTLLKDDNHSHGCYCSYLFERVDNCMCATARQRAEAFLKTIGGWKE